MNDFKEQTYISELKLKSKKRVLSCTAYVYSQLLPDLNSFSNFVGTYER